MLKLSWHIYFIYSLICYFLGASWNNLDFLDHSCIHHLNLPSNLSPGTILLNVNINQVIPTIKIYNNSNASWVEKYFSILPSGELFTLKPLNALKTTSSDFFLYLYEESDNYTKNLIFSDLTFTNCDNLRKNKQRLFHIHIFDNEPDKSFSESNDLSSILRPDDIDLSTKSVGIISEKNLKCLNASAFSISDQNFFIKPTLVSSAANDGRTSHDLSHDTFPQVIGRLDFYRLLRTPFAKYHAKGWTWSYQLESIPTKDQNYELTHYNTSKNINFLSPNHVANAILHRDSIHLNYITGELSILKPIFYTDYENDDSPKNFDNINPESDTMISSSSILCKNEQKKLNNDLTNNYLNFTTSRSIQAISNTNGKFQQSWHSGILVEERGGKEKDEQQQRENKEEWFSSGLKNYSKDRKEPSGIFKCDNQIKRNAKTIFLRASAKISSPTFTSHCTYVFNIVLHKLSKNKQLIDVNKQVIVHNRIKKRDVLTAVNRANYTLTVNESQVGPIGRLEPFYPGERAELIDVALFKQRQPVVLSPYGGDAKTAVNSYLTAGSRSSLPPPIVEIDSTSGIISINSNSNNNAGAILISSAGRGGAFSGGESTAGGNRKQMTTGLDFETADTIVLTVRIFNAQGGQERQTITLNVRDVNDEPPFFTNEYIPMEATIDPNTVPGTSNAFIFKLTAQDLDAGAYLRYNLESDPSKKFRVDPISGAIELKPNSNSNPAVKSAVLGGGGPSDFEYAPSAFLGPAGTEYVLRVSVRDIAGSYDQFATAQVSIVVGPRPPQFRSTSTADLNGISAIYPQHGSKAGVVTSIAPNMPNGKDIGFVMNVEEESEPGTLIGHVHAKSFNNRPIIYDLVPPSSAVFPGGDDDNQLFFGETAHKNANNGQIKDGSFNSNIDPRTLFSIKTGPLGGEIYLNKKLDYENFNEPKQYQAKIVAREIYVDPSTNNQQIMFERLADLTINVLDINDNGPVFSQPEYVKQKIPEDVPIGTELLKVQASDADSGHFGQITYDLLSAFEIIPPLITGANNFENTRITPGRANVLETFSIDPVTGVIRNRATLDYETPIMNSNSLTDGTNPNNLNMENNENINKINNFGRQNFNPGANNNDGFHQKHAYVFRVRARDNGTPARTSIAQVKIIVSNVNDEAPIFSRNVYVPEISEDASSGAVVLSVNAVDPDGDNVFYSFKGGSEYSDDFHINPDGVITLIGSPNTADSITENGIGNGLNKYHSSSSQGGTLLRKEFYTLNITATDDGSCCAESNGIRHVTEALVVVRVLDINNNKPEFPDCGSYNPTVLENSPPGTPVITVRAIDSDSGLNGQVRYNIEPGRARPVFTIEPDTGLVKTAIPLDREESLHLVSGSASNALNSASSSAVSGGYKRSLTVTATDRGDRPLIGVCTFTVNIGDRNDNEPSFSQSRYDKSVEAGTPVHTPFLRVSASDPDEGPNGEISYGLVKANSDAHAIWTAPDFMSLSSSFGATKQLDKSSEGEEKTSAESLEQLLGTDLFTIDPETGWISVGAPLIGESGDFNLTAIAQDKGTPALSSTVSVRIIVTGRDIEPPAWIGAPYHVTRLSEMAPRGSIVARLAALSMYQDPRVQYSILQGNQAFQNRDRTFEIVQDPTNASVALIKLYSSLDYERVSKYNITLRAKNNAPIQLESDTFITIDIEDANDNAPIFALDSFPATVREDSPPGTSVITVRAEDADLTSPANSITYEIAREEGAHFTQTTSDQETTADGQENIDDSSLEGSNRIQKDWAAFSINSSTGEIFTRLPLDREIKSHYLIRILAQDGMSSDITPGSPNSGSTYVRIKVEDVNDNVPYFLEPYYIAHVNEDARENSPVIEVSAKDADETSTQLRYQILSGNVGGVFDIKPSIGQIYVRGKLDYELGPRQYILKVLVTDGRNENSTLVSINVKDVNDNAPEFDSTLYEVRIPEETEFFSTADRQSADGIQRLDSNGDKISGLPHIILKLRATDRDTALPADIRYSLQGQGVDDKTFTIDEMTGEIAIHRKLDRDPPHGQPVWSLLALATDEGGRGNYGYADVRVILEDINDNAPVFKNTGHFSGSVPENSEAGRSVMTVRAQDADEGENAKLTYSIKTNVLNAEKMPIFAIDPLSGHITTLVANLDRETVDKYTIEVEARDKDGFSGTGFITIHVEDRNDQAPSFPTPKIYYSAVSESVAPLATAVFSVHAQDRDVGDNAKLAYTVKGEKTYKTNEEWSMSPEASFISMVLQQETSSTTTSYMENKNQVIDIEAKLLAAGLLSSFLSTASNNRNKLRYFGIASQTNTHQLIEMLNNSPQSALENSNLNSNNLLNNNGNGGDIVALRTLDYDNLEDGFRLALLLIEVTDGLFRDSALVLVNITDANDNAPSFTPALIRMALPELYTPLQSDQNGMAMPTSAVVNQLTTFPIYLNRLEARDADSGINGEFDYAIERINPPLVSATINSTGHVFLNGGQLDYETADCVVITVRARDRGTPSLSGRAQLRIDVVDINDNYPRFQINMAYFYVKDKPSWSTSVETNNINSPSVFLNESSSLPWQSPSPAVVIPEFPVAMETVTMATASQSPLSSRVIGLFTAQDPDNEGVAGHGPPFKFYGVPCDANPLCMYFNVTHIQDSGPNKNGSAMITLIRAIDRESNEWPMKWFDYPVRICDSGTPPLCGIDYLRIIIGDLNDQPSLTLEQYNMQQTYSLQTLNLASQNNLIDSNNNNNRIKRKADTFKEPRLMIKNNFYIGHLNGQSNSAFEQYEKGKIQNLHQNTQNFNLESKNNQNMNVNNNRRIKRSKSLEQHSGMLKTEGKSADSIKEDEKMDEILTKIRTHLMSDNVDDETKYNTKHIYVYNYKDQLESNTFIGTVWTADLDDWLRPGDKNFTLLTVSRINYENHHMISEDKELLPDFKCDSMNGEIRIMFDKGFSLMDSSYQLDFNVYDVKFMLNVPATVYVHIKRIDEMAFTQSISLILNDISPEQLLGASKSFWDTQLTPTYPYNFLNVQQPKPSKINFNQFNNENNHNNNYARSTDFWNQLNKWSGLRKILTSFLHATHLPLISRQKNSESYLNYPSLQTFLSVLKAFSKTTTMMEKPNPNDKKNLKHLIETSHFELLKLERIGQSFPYKTRLVFAVKTWAGLTNVNRIKTIYESRNNDEKHWDENYLFSNTNADLVEERIRKEVRKDFDNSKQSGYQDSLIYDWLLNTQYTLQYIPRLKMQTILTNWKHLISKALDIEILSIDNDNDNYFEIENKCHVLSDMAETAPQKKVSTAGVIDTNRTAVHLPAVLPTQNLFDNPKNDFENNKNLEIVRTSCVFLGPEWCYHGGICIDNPITGPSCECPPPFNMQGGGPRCEYSMIALNIGGALNRPSNFDLSTSYLILPGLTELLKSTKFDSSPLIQTKNGQDCENILENQKILQPIVLNFDVAFDMASQSGSNTRRNVTFPIISIMLPMTFDSDTYFNNNFNSKLNHKNPNILIEVKAIVFEENQQNEMITFQVLTTQLNDFENQNAKNKFEITLHKSKNTHNIELIIDLSANLISLTIDNMFCPNMNSCYKSMPLVLKTTSSPLIDADITAVYGSRRGGGMVILGSIPDWLEFHADHKHHFQNPKNDPQGKETNVEKIICVSALRINGALIDLAGRYTLMSSLNKQHISYTCPLLNKAPSLTADRDLIRNDINGDDDGHMINENCDESLGAFFNFHFMAALHQDIIQMIDLTANNNFILSIQNNVSSANEFEPQNSLSNTIESFEQSQKSNVASITEQFIPTPFDTNTFSYLRVRLTNSHENANVKNFKNSEIGTSKNNPNMIGTYEALSNVLELKFQTIAPFISAVMSQINLRQQALTVPQTQNLFGVSSDETYNNNNNNLLLQTWLDKYFKPFSHSQININVANDNKNFDEKSSFYYEPNHERNGKKSAYQGSEYISRIFQASSLDGNEYMWLDLVFPDPLFILETIFNSLSGQMLPPYSTDKWLNLNTEESPYNENSPQNYETFLNLTRNYGLPIDPTLFGSLRFTYNLGYPIKIPAKNNGGDVKTTYTMRVETPLNLNKECRLTDGNWKHIKVVREGPIAKISIFNCGARDYTFYSSNYFDPFASLYNKNLNQYSTFSSQKTDDMNVTFGQVDKGGPLENRMGVTAKSWESFEESAYMGKHKLILDARNVYLGASVKEIGQGKNALKYPFLGRISNAWFDGKRIDMSISADFSNTNENKNNINKNIPLNNKNNQQHHTIIEHFFMDSVAGNFQEQNNINFEQKCAEKTAIIDQFTLAVNDPLLNINYNNRRNKNIKAKNKNFDSDSIKNAPINPNSNLCYHGNQRGSCPPTFICQDFGFSGSGRMSKSFISHYQSQQEHLYQCICPFGTQLNINLGLCVPVLDICNALTYNPCLNGGYCQSLANILLNSQPSQDQDFRQSSSSTRNSHGNLLISRVENDRNVTFLRQQIISLSNMLNGAPFECICPAGYGCSRCECNTGVTADGTLSLEGGFGRDHMIDKRGATVFLSLSQSALAAIILALCIVLVISLFLIFYTRAHTAALLKGKRLLESNSSPNHIINEGNENGDLKNEKSAYNNSNNLNGGHIYDENNEENNSLDEWGRQRLVRNEYYNGAHTPGHMGDGRHLIGEDLMNGNTPGGAMYYDGTESDCTNFDLDRLRRPITTTKLLVTQPNQNQPNNLHYATLLGRSDKSNEYTSGSSLADKIRQRLDAVRLQDFSVYDPDECRHDNFPKNNNSMLGQSFYTPFHFAYEGDERIDSSQLLPNVGRPLSRHSSLSSLNTVDGEPNDHHLMLNNDLDDTENDINFDCIADWGPQFKRLADICQSSPYTTKNHQNEF